MPPALAITTLPDVRLLPLGVLRLLSQGTGPVAAAAQEGAMQERLELCDNCCNLLP